PKGPWNAIGHEVATFGVARALGTIFVTVVFTGGMVYGLFAGVLIFAIARRFWMVAMLLILAVVFVGQSRLASNEFAERGMLTKCHSAVCAVPTRPRRSSAFVATSARWATPRSFSAAFNSGDDLPRRRSATSAVIRCPACPHASRGAGT